jgi:primosomal replication protein N''
MVLNPSLPLVLHGEIVTPAWLLAHPEEGWELLAGGAPEYLARMGREPWLVRLRARAEAVRARARLLEVELDEERARLAMLTSSRANLEAERELLRKIYPDAEQPGLAALLDRSRLPDEDLIVLVSAAREQLVPLATVVGDAERLAREVGIASWDENAAAAALVRPRRALYEEADRRTAGFARCRIERVDEWADGLRVERRLPLARVIVLLAVPEAAWQALPKQDYVSRLLEHFEKRVAGAVLRGPLVRFLIGKTTPRLDLAELGTATRPAQALLDQVLRREDVPVTLDPEALAEDPGREVRLRRLVSQAEVFRRDTGIDGRYLGFPSCCSATPARSAPDRARALRRCCCGRCGSTRLPAGCRRSRSTCGARRCASTRLWTVCWGSRR